MKKVISVSFFDIEFDNRVKKCLTSFGGQAQKIVLYNNVEKQDYQDAEFDNLIFLNANVKSSSKLIRVVKILIFFLRKCIYLKPDVIICNDIQPVPSILIYKYFFNKKVHIIYDSHEIQQTLYPSAFKIVFQLESSIMSVSSMNLTVSENIAKFMNEQYGKPVYVLPNYPSISNGGLITREYLNTKYSIHKDDKLIVYTGVLMQSERCIGEAVESLKNLSSEYKMIISAVGNIEEFKNFVFGVCLKYGIPETRIRFVGPYNETDLLDLLRSCDLSLLLYNYRLSKNLDINAPNKLFQGLVAGIPLLMSNNTSFKKVVGESPVYVGELVDPLDVDEISRKIKFILERESLIEDRIALCEYGRKFSWDSVSMENKLIFDTITNA